MAGTNIRMIGDGSHSLSDIHASIHYIKGAEQVFHQEMRFDRTDVWLLVYEKYFFRNNSYASLTVLLTQQDEKQTAQIVVSGSGAGMANVSLAAGGQLAKECVQALAEVGFTVDMKNSDSLPQSLLERFMP